MNQRAKCFRDGRRIPAPTAKDARQTTAYVCVLCHQLLDLDKPQQSTCGDRACRTCIDVLADEFEDRNLTGISCPACQETLQPSLFFQDRAVARELMLLQVACPHLCSWSGSYKDYEGHLSTCPLHPVSCPHLPCTTVEVPSRLKSHIEICAFRPVTCQYCSKMMQYRVLESHESTDCERRPVSCSLCGETVPFNSITLHEQEECARAVRPCPFAEFGCDVRQTCTMHVPSAAIHHWNKDLDIWARRDDNEDGGDHSSYHSSYSSYSTHRFIAVIAVIALIDL